jgi:hypothetical protein
MRDVYRRQPEETKKPGNLAGISNAYHTVHKFPRPAFQHYYESLFGILSFIDDSDLKGEDRLFYAKVIRSLLSGDELVVLLYHCLVDDPRQPYTEIIDKYRILEFVDRKSLLDPGNIEFYQATFMVNVHPKGL